MKLAVFGANGPTGRLLTQLALDEDHDVVAFTRHPDAFPVRHRRLEVAAGDVHDAAVRGKVRFVVTAGVMAVRDADFEIRTDGHVKARDERGAAAA